MLHGLTVLALQAAVPSVPARPTPLLSTIGEGGGGCREGEGEEVVVCGRRGDDRYRLPFRDDRVGPQDLPIGSQSRLARDFFTSGPCGVFAGQRKCDKREMQMYGYGGGKDPITFTRKVLEQVLDPDE